MSESQPTWIIASGQAWKLYVALAGFAGALLCFIWAGFSLGGEMRRVMELTAYGVVLGVATFVWLTLALRCPHCTTKLVWTMVASRPHSSWLIDLAALESCPVCRHGLIRGHHSTP